MRFHSTYFGINIWRNNDPNKLRWTALTRNGSIAADTLAGIKILIKERI